MSIDNNIHNVGVILGITDGVLKDDGTLKEFSPEWFKEKSKEFEEEENKSKELYQDFSENYNPIALNNFNGEKLLKKLFLGASSENLAHTLEYISINNELFGSIKGGNSFKYPLHYDNESGSWVSGTYKNPKYLSLNDAISVGEEVRKMLISTGTIVTQKMPLDSIEKYLELYADLVALNQNYVESIWFLKYLHMICPSDFPTFYTRYWQEKVLTDLSISPLDSSFGRIGQIMIFIKKCNISTVAFNKIYHKYVKQNIDDRENVEESERITGGKNVILYGVPGAGKSYEIKHHYCDDEKKMERLVFHPDYTYSDFVGQILPNLTDGIVSYEFTPGPFTKILKKAYYDPATMYYLVIEEVNRGNAPAIFGDIFQLLDRNDNGSSEYKITNRDIAKIVFDNEDEKVFIPSNLTILCTMNTSDQNVFTLDTAFQRRWNMKLIKNKFRENDAEEQQFAHTKILDSNVEWEHFFKEINDIILTKNIRMTSAEDKRLGTHFVSEKDLKFVPGDEEQNSKFPEKVLKYLWDDAFKFTKEDIFDLQNVKSLEDVIQKFNEKNGDDRFKVFKENIFNTIVNNKN